MRAYAILFISWLIPGSGHLLQKRIFKGLAFFFGICLLVFMGLVMHGKIYSTTPFHPLLVLGFMGDLGNGILFFLIRFLVLAEGDIRVATFHYGTTYIAVAGLINYLAALNAFDIARGRKK